MANRTFAGKNISANISLKKWAQTKVYINS